MDDLFFALMLISLLCFIVALVKPTIFNKIFWNNVTRTKTSKYFWSAIIIFLILFMIVLEPINKPWKETNIKINTKTVVQEKQIEDTSKKLIDDNNAIKKEEPIVNNIIWTYEKYSYTITINKQDKKHVVIFQPFLPRDDSVVLWSINNVTNQVFWSGVLDGTKPTLENLEGWANAILFNTPKWKYYYLLFKEDTGEVNGFSFWKE